MHMLNCCPVMLMVGCKSSVLYQPQWEMGQLDLTGLEMGTTTEASQGAIFKKLFTPKCRLSDPDSLDHLIFFSFNFLFVT